MWHGLGEMTSNNGEQYIGQYCQDKKHGHGLYKWSDGRIYHGKWLDNKKTLKCVFQETGHIYKGNY